MYSSEQVRDAMIDSKLFTKKNVIDTGFFQNKKSWKELNKIFMDKNYTTKQIAGILVKIK